MRHEERHAEPNWEAIRYWSPALAAEMQALYRSMRVVGAGIDVVKGRAPSLAIDPVGYNERSVAQLEDKILRRKHIDPDEVLRAASAVTRGEQ